jgi:outer membrane receptor protein involved in Fe transport
MRAANIALALSLLSAAMAALGSDFTGQSLEHALDELQARGLTVLYSSDLVKPGMRVVEPPTEQTPRALLEEIVRPHGIAITEAPGGLLLLTRAPTQLPGATIAPGEETVAEVIVTASRYEWVRTPHSSVTHLSDAELRLPPNVGDDPMRTLARLPGITGSDLSAKVNVRGGATDETLVRFDGLQLMNPFHLKDFQSIFSAINPALIRTVDVYTGGFPVHFGDRMSGVIDIHPVRADGVAQREIAVSLYNASLLATGRMDEGRADWAVSARRGNLERVLQWSGMDLGNPTYSDAYAHVGHRIGRSMSVSANLLLFDDDIELADTDREEQASARYRDRYTWVRLDAHPRESLTGSAILAQTNLESARSGAAEQPGISRGVLDERRDSTIHSLQTDWTWQASDAAIWQFGGEWRSSEGSYRYRDQAEFDVIFEVPNATASAGRAHDIDARHSIRQFGAYAAVRTEVTPMLSFESGIRWDHSTAGEDEAQWSPRAGALLRLSESASLHASWGRFVQTQSINELPVSDGVVAFAPAQRADHWLLSFEQRLGQDVGLRIEVYHKRYSHLRPRFENLLNTLVVLPELKPDRISIAPERARSEGVEFSVRSVRSRPMFWWASYTWSRADDLFADGSSLRSWDYRHALSAGLGWQGEHWEFSAAGLWRSGLPATKFELQTIDGESVVHADAMNTSRLEPWRDIDVRLARKFQFNDGGSLTAFLEISNVLNHRNECCIEYEIADEEDESGFVVESIRSLPLLPSIGVVWRF